MKISKNKKKPTTTGMKKKARKKKMVLDSQTSNSRCKSRIRCIQPQALNSSILPKALKGSIQPQDLNRRWNKRCRRAKNSSTVTVRKDPIRDMVRNKNSILEKTLILGEMLIQEEKLIL